MKGKQHNLLQKLDQNPSYITSNRSSDAKSANSHYVSSSSISPFALQSSRQFVLHQLLIHMELEQFEFPFEICNDKCLNTKNQINKGRLVSQVPFPYFPSIFLKSLIISFSHIFVTSTWPHFNFIRGRWETTLHNGQLPYENGDGTSVTELCGMKRSK